MRILEILLPKSIRDKDLSPHTVNKIDAIQKRMTSYVDKLCSPHLSPAGREFLKLKLKDDYDKLKDVLSQAKEVVESEEVPVPISPLKYEVYDRKTGLRVSGPYSSKNRARRVVDKKDNEYGAYRYGVRPAPLTEAVHKLPLTTEDFDLVKDLMSKPIPAAVAPIYIQEIIEDDEFSDQLRSIEDTDPGRDVRLLVVEWFRRVMPDQMYRFSEEERDKSHRDGTLSPIHGYDPRMYRSDNSPITGNAFGKL